MSIQASVYGNLKGLREYLNNNKEPDDITSVLNERHNYNKNALNMVFLEPNQTKYITFGIFGRTTRACRSLHAVNWLIVYELVKYGFDPHYKDDYMKETPFETMQRCYKGITREILEESLKPFYLLEDEKGVILNAFFPQGSSAGSSSIGTPPPSPRA